MTDVELIATIKREEGWPAFTNDPTDLGGPTKGGITLDTLRVWRRNPFVTVEQLKLLDDVEADAIYQFMFLQPFAGITDAALRACLVDLGVLRGPREAGIMLQELVGARPADGWIGAETLAALTPFQPHALVMLIGARFAQIESRIRDAPLQVKFRNGWRARNQSFLPRG
jgi:lysozyme family protein